MYGNVKPDHNHMSMGMRRRFSERLTLEAINGNCLYCKNLGFCLNGFQLRISRCVQFVLVGEHHVERNIIAVQNVTLWCVSFYHHVTCLTALLRKYTTLRLLLKSKRMTVISFVNRYHFSKLLPIAFIGCICIP